jgi:hypothetical protein
VIALAQNVHMIGHSNRFELDGATSALEQLERGGLDGAVELVRRGEFGFPPVRQRRSRSRCPTC